MGGRYHSRRDYLYDDDDDSEYTSEEEEDVRTWRDVKLQSNKRKTFLSQVPVTKMAGSLLRAGLPPQFKPWVTTVQNGKPFNLKKIGPTDPVYTCIVNKIKLNGNIGRIIITSIHEVVCPYIMTLYQLKKLDMKRIHKNKLKELELYHGTHERNCKSICNKNFNYRLCGTSRGTKYGQGMSFSPHFFYAKCFCNKVPNSIKTMFLCNVLYVNGHVGDKHTIVPEDGFDTTTKEEGQVFVKYDDDTYVPRYKIKFILKY